MKYELKPLPYSYESLEPVISKEILLLHHDKHHQAYVNGANSALEKLELARTGETEISIKSVLKDLSFNLNGHILHELFWENMQSPKENNIPGNVMLERIETNFGTFESFKKEFSEGAKTVEGSGWIILGKNTSGDLLNIQIEKHNLNIILDFIPILVLDVWEHSYYLDYKNDRGLFVENWWKVINWNIVENR